MSRLKNESGVYAIVCLANGKTYIGSAVCIRKRFNAHRSALRKDEHRNAHLQRAWNKYGEDCFEFVILRTVRDPANLLKWEQYWINRTENKFNIRRKAESALGVKRRQETRDRISKALSGRKLSPEHCAKISNVQLGRKLSKEHREAISLGNLWKTKKHSKEHCKKLSEVQRGKTRNFTDDHRRNLSLAAMGRSLSSEHKAAISRGNKGKKRVFTEAHKASIKAAWDKRKGLT